MFKRLPMLALALFVLPTAACSNQPNDPAYAHEVAEGVNRDCESARSQAPNAAFAHHLDRLCKCTHDKIAATAMNRSEGQQADYEKIQAAMKVCSDQLGGVPDAEDYRASRMKPPVNSAQP